MFLIYHKMDLLFDQDPKSSKYIVLYYSIMFEI